MEATKQSNKIWAYVYLAIGFGFLTYGMAFNENYWLYIFSTIMFALAGYRLFWLDKKL
jgi:hypothetical protein